MTDAKPTVPVMRRTKRARDVVLVVVAGALLLSALVHVFCLKTMPDVVTLPEYSDLESRYYTTGPTWSTESFADRSFQSGFDAFLADRIPYRNNMVLMNAGLQRTGIATSAALLGYDVYPTFFDSHYYVVPRDGIIVDRPEAAPAPDKETLQAWIGTLNNAAEQHPNMRMIYNCIARHDQCEANPAYRYFSNRINPAWIQANILDRLDPRIESFVDSVQSYDEIAAEWMLTEEHWTLERALKSYNQVADRLSLKHYTYTDPVQVVTDSIGDYARSGLDFDILVDLDDMPIDFSNLTFYELNDPSQPDDGTNLTEKWMGLHDGVLSGEIVTEPRKTAQYYNYFGGGSAEAVNAGENNGKTMMFVGDSLAYCLQRYLASNYKRSIFLLPGNSRLTGSLEDYIQKYHPDDLIVMTHATKYETFAEFSPEIIGM